MSNNSDELVREGTPSGSEHSYQLGGIYSKEASVTLENYASYQ
jgi:hypothetical protein